MFIAKRKVKRYIYYYAVQQARVNGKPRIVWQQYLGTAENIVKQRARLKKTDKEQLRTLDWQFGNVCAVLTIARQIKLQETVNSFIPIKFRSVTTGDYILLAAINRCLDPTSKNSLAQWYQRTSLLRLLKFNPTLLTSQRFWDHMNLITQERISQIENRLSEILIKEFNLDLHCLIYDTTNFFTYIDTFNTKSILAQRGHNKQKRLDLRQINLALLVTKNFHIPLFHKVYEGNIVDRTAFKSVVEELVERYKILSQNCEQITIIYDKGNNSPQAQNAVDESPYHFVGSLVPSHHSDLLSIPLEKFHSFENEKLEGVKAYRTEKEVFGKKQTIVIIRSEEFFLKQLQTIVLQLKKRTHALKELKHKLRKSKKITLEAANKQVEKILSFQHMKELIKVELTKETKQIKFSYFTDNKELKNLQDTLLGKTILFTDQDSWSDEEIVLAYRGQYKIEKAFKQMKNHYFVSWYPMFHWTDQKIRVHAFYCVLALTLVSLLTRKLHLAGINLSSDEILKQLKEIKETLIVKLPKKNKTIEQNQANNYLTKNESDLLPSAMNRTQQHIFDALNLSQFLAS